MAGVEISNKVKQNMGSIEKSVTYSFGETMMGEYVSTDTVESIVSIDSENYPVDDEVKSTIYGEKAL